MDEHLQNSSKLRHSFGNDGDAMYVSGLSTVLVATIQEAKDRISQIEYIFCSQLFPNFQSKSKSLQRIYAEARSGAEDAWKEKESKLLLQIENLQLEKQQAIQENHSLKLHKENPSKEQENKMKLLLADLESQRLKIDELQQELMKKSKEVDEGMKLQSKLLELVQTRASEILDKGKQLKKQEEKNNILLAERNILEEKVGELQEELRKKAETVDEKNEIIDQLVKKFDSTVSEEQMLANHSKEKKQLLAKLERLEKNVEELQEELRRKTEKVAEKKEEVEFFVKKVDWLMSEGFNGREALEQENKDQKRKLNSMEVKIYDLEKMLSERAKEMQKAKEVQERLLTQIDASASEVLKKTEMLEECEKDKKQLITKLNFLQEKVNGLLLKPGERLGVVAQGRDSYEKLIEQIESNASELLTEKKKRRDITEAYKRLKSQYNFLLEKFGLTTENMPPYNKSEEEFDALKHQQNATTSPDLENRNLDTSTGACETNQVKDEIGCEDGLEDIGEVNMIQGSNFQSTTAAFPHVPNGSSTVKSAPVAGTKRPASHWIDTRSRQCKDGPDPHDDFLNTPFENVRGNLNKVLKEEVHDLPSSVSKDMNPASSDDETQDINAGLNQQKQRTAAPAAERKCVKYVEPVRKKAERENLKGFECKQCQKFYDAVLPENGGKDPDGNKQNFRCEHHDGVSRHRYRYIPPMTPEGFWNIGFESEM